VLHAAQSSWAHYAEAQGLGRSLLRINNNVNCIHVQSTLKLTVLEGVGAHGGTCLCPPLKSETRCKLLNCNFLHYIFAVLRNSSALHAHHWTSCKRKGKLPTSKCLRQSTLSCNSCTTCSAKLHSNGPCRMLPTNK